MAGKHGERTGSYGCQLWRQAGCGEPELPSQPFFAEHTIFITGMLCFMHISVTLYCLHQRFQSGGVQRRAIRAGHQQGGRVQPGARTT